MIYSIERGNEVTKEELERSGVEIETDHYRFGCYRITIKQDGVEVKPYLAVGKGYRKMCIYLNVEGKGGMQFNYLHLVNTMLGDNEVNK